jgi:hypothetical protein
MCNVPVARPFVSFLPYKRDVTTAFVRCMTNASTKGGARLVSKG